MSAIPPTLDALRVPVESLKPYGRNPRRGDVPKIVESLSRHGQYRPIVVNARTQEVLAGNHTLAAARELGWDDIAATFVDVDEDTAARIVLIDNRSNDVAGYEDEVLAQVLSELPDLEGTGYASEDLDGLLASLTPTSPGKDTEPGALPPEPRTRPGDLYVLGEHRLLCGDATVVTDAERLIAGERAQLVFTDPPYGVDYDGGPRHRKLANDERGSAIYERALPIVLVCADENAALYLWCADKVSGQVAGALMAAGFEIRAQIIWVKNLAPLTGAQYKAKHEPCLYAHRAGRSPRWYGPKNEVTVWEADRASANEYHPTQKPIELAERALTNSSLSGEIVIDLFGGSGSTLIAAENLGRRALLMELDPGYCDVIVDRWERHTGQSAELTREADRVAA